MIGLRKYLEKDNYILKADTNSNYWFGLSTKRIDYYLLRCVEYFNIILFGNETNETDYYVIPYNYIKDLLTEETKSKSKNRERWVGDISNNKLRIRNTKVKRNIIDFYSLPLASSNTQIVFDSEIENDFAIENAKREINIRIKQSIFRSKVLDNFNFRCCLTNTLEEDLIVASHIIPWSHQTINRLNPGNGICFSIIYDKLFDKGYFTLCEDLTVLITSRVENLSEYIKNTLEKISNQKINDPRKYQILTDALNYHRDNIFDKF